MIGTRTSKNPKNPVCQSRRLEPKIKKGEFREGHCQQAQVFDEFIPIFEVANRGEEHGEENDRTEGNRSTGLPSGTAAL
jgi:hypothetical protein